MEERGVAVQCALDGTIQSVIKDDDVLSGKFQAGSHIRDFVDSYSHEKFDRFIDELQSQQVAFNWEINVTISEMPVALHFAGAKLGVGYLIMAAHSSSGLSDLNNELTRINNEQVNLIRSLAKERSMVSGERALPHITKFEEFTSLNNEMANMHRELARKNSELVQINNQKNRLLGMVAHDLRNPLGVILTYSEFLENEAASVLNKEQRQFVTTIKDMSEFMLNMVSDLLDVAAIESGELKLIPEPTDLVSLVQRNVALNQVLAAKKGISITFESPVAHRRVTLDPGKIDQVLNNLISNAVKFSHHGTQVLVTLQWSPTMVTVTVGDQGQGIPPTDLAKLFQPFSTASVRGTDGEQSTGLGLAIVRKIIEGHGGHISVESKVGVGSKFTFAIPSENTVGAFHAT